MKIEAAGAEAAADEKNVRSPETYVGYERAEHFASSGGAVHDTAHAYSLPPSLGLNEWGLDGSDDPTFVLVVKFVSPEYTAPTV